ncbi:MAG: CoxG family protein [Methyloligellaceae bacterium]
MKLDDEITIEAPRDEVFAALNDPKILRASIPGCEKLEKLSDTHFTAVIRVKVGPVRARFKGDVTLSNLKPPESYTLSGQGKGRAAGFARGKADVQLIAEGDATLLKYDATARVGGKLAQLGGRLLDSSARALAREFFEGFQKVMDGECEEAASKPREIAS